jgi:hypothetical protein
MLFKKLNEDYPDAASCASDLKAKLEEFSKHLPLIRCFTSEAIMDEDWTFIQEVVQKSNTIPSDVPFERDDIKISDFDEFQLHQFIEEIEDITMRA